ncbi:hypothetical protein SNE510_59080 [Streptomyces sp. NE5-10]|nr:hypothetical protein SNE510_59080 [Streptomyces sp. NE5-10]
MIDAVSEKPASSATVTASAMPSTARNPVLSRRSPGSGATNILFTAVGRPLVLPLARRAPCPGGGGARTDTTKAPASGAASSPTRRCGAENI